MSWKESTGVSESTTRIQVYCPEEEKKRWEEEVEEKGYKSLSTYLYELIQEARAYRRQGFLAHHQSEEKIESLQEEVARLEEELEKQEKRSSGQVQIDDTDVLYRFLSTEYKPLEEIIRDIVESGVLDDLVRKRVENQLYVMAQSDRVEYQRGSGWKRSGGDD